MYLSILRKAHHDGHLLDRALFNELNNRQRNARPVLFVTPAHRRQTQQQLEGPMAALQFVQQRRHHQSRQAHAFFSALHCGQHQLHRFVFSN